MGRLRLLTPCRRRSIAFDHGQGQATVDPNVPTKQIAGHCPVEVAWQLRELAVEHRTTVQALLGEALNDLFQKHGKPEIASPH